jgi:hypothetical protein
MVGARDDQLGIWHSARDDLEGLEHRLQPLVRAPFSESQNPVIGISASRECRIFRPAREDSVIPDVDSPSAIFLPDNAAVGRHKHRNRVGKQKQLRGGITCGGIDVAETNARILEIYRLHELVKRDMGVETRRPNHRWKRHSKECRKRLATEAGETKIEPHDIGVDLPDGPQQAHRIPQAVE